MVLTVCMSLEGDAYSAGTKKFIRFLEGARTGTKFVLAWTVFMRNTSAELLGSPHRARPLQHTSPVSII